MKLIKHIALISLLAATTTINAQQDTNRSFFKQSMNLVNPAFAGSQASFTDSQIKSTDKMPEFGINFRSQWAGVDGAPETQSFFFSSSMGKNVGLGVSIVNDRTFIENQTALAVDFSYQLKLNDNNLIYLGLKAGASSYNANLLGLTTFGFGSDPSLNNINGSFNSTIGVGALLKGKKYFVSLSTPNFLNAERLQEIDGTAQLGASRTHFYLASGFDIALSSSLNVSTAAIARYVENAPLSIELNTLFNFNDKIQLGPSYRVNEGVGGLFMVNAADWVDIGYAFETGLNSLVAARSMGTHEVFMKLKL